MLVSSQVPDPDAQYQRALALHDRGQVADAEQLYRTILREHPRHFGAAYSLGAVLLSRDEYEAAEQQFGLATSLEPRNPLAQINRGVALKNLGRLEDALRCIDAAIAVYPQFALAHYNRGNVLSDLGRFADAIASYERAIALEPRHAQAFNNRGIALRELGRAKDAVESFDKAIALDPGFAQALDNRGNALSDMRRFEEAIASYGRAIALKPDYGAALRNRGHVLAALGRLDDALASYDQAIMLKLDDVQALNDRGRALGALGRHQEAIASCDFAIELKPDFADAYNNRGSSLRELKRFGDALASFDRALELKPDLAAALNNRAIVLQDLARIDDAVASYRRSLVAKPDFDDARSNLLFALNYQDRVTQEDVFAEHCAWEERDGPARPSFSEVARDPGRVLRVGYVSGDLRNHSVAFFFEPLLQATDRGAFHVTCYTNGSDEDATTERLRALSDAWRTIAAKSDDEAHALIRNDRIDILVDLSGHTGRNRLKLFARRAAPIQVTYLGYPNTTGIKAIDCRFTDAVADPVGSTEALHTETLVRLDGGFLCYRPPEDSPAVAESPAAGNGRITFGSFNALAKVNAALIARWSAILESVAGSRLILKARSFADPAARNHIQGLFKRNGIAPERIELSDWTADTRSHLERYGEIDIALDTFPYNGTATTCEALWMGVPVITMSGRVHASRVGASLLSRIGLDALIASSPEAYVQAAIDLAHDIPRLRDLRGTLRARMVTSPLMDSARIARAVETAYRTMWRQYCLKR